MDNLTFDAFERKTLMAKIIPQNGKYLSCGLLYKGDLVPKNVSTSFAKLKTKRTINFADWQLCGFKVGINY